MMNRIHDPRPSLSQVLRITAWCLYLSLMADSQTTAQSTDATSAWPQWGRDATKNMVGPAKANLPTEIVTGRLTDDDEIDMATTKGVRWVAKLGSNSYGNPTVADGRVYVGTNNEASRSTKYKGDRSNVYCLDERTGSLLWQFSAPKLGAGKVSDWEYLGICSSPTIDGDRVYFITNRCEVICLDVHGMANGNDGPFMDEGAYAAGPGKPPIPMGPEDADIIWIFDMAGELEVFPHNVASSSVLVVGDRVYANTSNGVDYSHKHIINPNAPSLVALDKRTGEIVGEEQAGIGTRIYHGNWSSPAHAVVNGRDLILLGAGDGFCYAFDAATKRVTDARGFVFDVLPEVWRFDCNPAHYKIQDGKTQHYGSRDGPSEIIATPVYHDNRLYVAIGQDPEHGEGLGALSCIDATRQGDISADGLLWQYTDMNRTISTVSIHDSLVYIADYAGFVHCLDADSGALQWKHDTLGHIWGSTLVTDGRVFVGNEDGILTILKAGREKILLSEIEVAGSIYGSTVVANGTLYIETMTHLYAIGR